MHFFLNKVDGFFVVALQTQAANAADCFTVKINQIKQSDMVAYHYYFLFAKLPKQSKSSSQGILPGAPWCSAATE